MIPPHLEGCRVHYDGHRWALIDFITDDEVMLVRAIVPMEEYDTVFVHPSEVDFGVSGWPTGAVNVIRSEN